MFGTLDNDEVVELVHDGDIIVKYYTAEYDPEMPEGYEYYNNSNNPDPAQQGKLSYVKELGYYFVKVTFVGTNNCAQKEASGRWRRRRDQVSFLSVRKSVLRKQNAFFCAPGVPKSLGKMKSAGLLTCALSAFCTNQLTL